MDMLKEKAAVVNGASRGIGRATTERLAQEGAAVVVNYATSADEANAVVKGIEAQGGKALALQADIEAVSKLTSIRKIGP